MTICSSEHGRPRGKERAMRIIVEKCRNGGYNGEAEPTGHSRQWCCKVYNRRERGKTRGVARIFERGVTLCLTEGTQRRVFLMWQRRLAKGEGVVTETPGGGGLRDKKLGHYTTTDIKRNRHLRALYFSVLHVVANAYLREWTLTLSRSRFNSHNITVTHLRLVHREKALRAC